MKHILVAALFFASQVSFGSELDLEHELLKRAHDLPGSVVVRTNLHDGAVDVLHVNEKLPADKATAAVLAKAPFQAISVDGQLAGLAGNEQDSISSTSSWGLAFGLAALGIGVASFALGRSSAYAGYYAPAYQPYAPPAYGYAPAYSPYYSYGGYGYAYSPYYSYNSGAYNYGYYANPWAYSGFSASAYWSYSGHAHP